jgi:hypothetical protein
MKKNVGFKIEDIKNIKYASIEEVNASFKRATDSKPSKELIEILKVLSKD